MLNRHGQSQRGQVGVIVLLITAIVLIFGLSVANRVVKENQLVLDQSDATRVFNIAEDGIDQALNQIYQYELSGLTDLPSSFGDQNSQVTIDINEEFTGFIGPGDNLRIKLVNGQTGLIVINWSKINCATGGNDLLLSLVNFNSTSNQYENHYYLVGACAAANQNFIQPSTSSLEPYQFAYQLSIDATSNQDATLYIRSLGTGTELNLSASSGLIENSQYQITSLASSDSEVRDSNKAIEVKKSLPSAPTFMNFALFSGGSIIK